MIDSNGKPGTGGNANGVETELGAVYVITVVLTVVGVVLDVVTGVEDVVLTLLTLLVLDVALEVVVTTDVLVTTLVDVVEAAVVPPPPPPPVAPGGSRCNINASEVDAAPVTVVPTARPLVLDLKKRDWNDPPFPDAGVIAGVKDISVQLVPS
jgi:hypothetical protein